MSQRAPINSTLVETASAKDISAPQQAYGDKTQKDAARSPLISPGTGVLLNTEAFKARQINQNTSIEHGHSFVFRQAPIDAVINEVLGETFGTSYVIDPAVSGTLSLRLEGIVGEEEALAALNAALGLQGLEAAHEGNVVSIRRQSRDSSSSGHYNLIAPDDLLTPDSSLAIVQVQFAQADEIADIIAQLVPSELVRFTDDARGLIALSGDPNQVFEATRLIRALDVDWLHNTANAILPVSSAAPSQLVKELEPVLARTGGLSLIPIDRLQSIMVVSRSPEQLMQAKEWISRFDAPHLPSILSDILIYEAKHIDAEDLQALIGISGNSQSSRQSQSIEVDSVDENTPPLNAPSTSTPDNTISFYSTVSIRIDENQNAIVARGSAVELKSLAELLPLLDRPKRQVLIEATIVEVTLSDGESLGVEWDAVQDQLAATFSTDDDPEVGSLFPGLSVSYINTDVAAVVNALATTSEVEVISSPRMMVLNNETARLQIGDQVPIITQSAVSVTDPGAPVVNSTTYRDTGVILTVTPRIRSGGVVEIDIAQEVSGVSETTSSSIDSPTISQRSLESVLAVPSGTTAILGGLMSSTRSRSNSGVPVLKDIPILGSAFRSTSKNERRTELVILIEPTMLTSNTPIISVPDRLRQALLEVRGK